MRILAARQHRWLSIMPRIVNRVESLNCLHSLQKHTIRIKRFNCAFMSGKWKTGR